MKIYFQANNLFKVIIAGAQLVGRAFGRAIRKEFAGLKVVQVTLNFSKSVLSQSICEM